MAADPPTLQDLDDAKAELARQLDRQARYDGNNPNKFATAVREARETVASLTQSLKAAGLLARTEHEHLEARLDAKFPKARPKDIVTFEKERYQRWMEPATRTLSGQVSTWARGWKALTSGPPAVELNGEPAEED